MYYLVNEWYNSYRRNKYRRSAFLLLFLFVCFLIYVALKINPCLLYWEGDQFVFILIYFVGFTSLYSCFHVEFRTLHLSPVRASSNWLFNPFNKNLADFDSCPAIRYAKYATLICYILCSRGMINHFFRVLAYFNESCLETQSVY